jgi:hypothetical protein
MSRRTAAANANARAKLPDTDPAIEPCEAWLSRQDHYDRLQMRWQRTETALYRRRNWPKLSAAERAKFPQKLEMDALSQSMNALGDVNDKLFAALHAIGATTRLGICAKLEVAARQDWLEEYPEFRELLASILLDCRALHEPK